ncbi:MAG: hypothetical protein IJ530_07885 [Treponema sp.]|uniref:hypothetical protein n=1 Tax=Treponema sp. TaxID=166 RepID=UPI0025F1489B|nr:hypothetical protein [Treponema sp.]MBQ8679669.1 hypothetical protein [Treponema sp.]
MNFKPDIIEKSESLIDNINDKTLPDIQATLKNVNEISGRVNNGILTEVQKTLEYTNEMISRVNKILPVVVVALSLVAVAALGTFAGVLVLLFR